MPSFLISEGHWRVGNSTSRRRDKPVCVKGWSVPSPSSCVNQPFANSGIGCSVSGFLVFLHPFIRSSVVKIKVHLISRQCVWPPQKPYYSKTDGWAGIMRVLEAFL
ncbi:hypothetical protein BT93_H3214 [Corymbia citriodora subsp. variegata]|nr:hypothetical protein BT93_H3214 [Corymbia citriodora subsp. variegata]